jgi:hypothetical protein
MNTLEKYLGSIGIIIGSLDGKIVEQVEVNLKS